MPQISESSARPKKPVLILGAGVSGLSTGIILQKNGFQTKIWAKDVPPNTTSNTAAAFWYPFIVNPPEKAARWAEITLDFLLKHRVSDSKSGTYPIEVGEIFVHPKEDP